MAQSLDGEQVTDVLDYEGAVSFDEHRVADSSNDSAKDDLPTRLDKLIRQEDRLCGRDLSEEATLLLASFLRQGRCKR